MPIKRKLDDIWYKVEKKKDIFEAMLQNRIIEQNRFYNLFLFDQLDFFIVEIRNTEVCAITKQKTYYYYLTQH